MKKYMAIEHRISAIPAVHTIGALSVETQPLKHALRNEASTWKAQYASKLHKQCAEDLKVKLPLAMMQLDLLCGKVLESEA